MIKFKLIKKLTSLLLSMKINTAKKVQLILPFLWLIILLGCKEDKLPFPINFSTQVSNNVLNFQLNGLGIEHYEINFGDKASYFYYEANIYKEGINDNYVYTQDGEFIIKIIAYTADKQVYRLTKNIQINYFAPNDLLSDFTITPLAASCFQIKNNTKKNIVSYYTIANILGEVFYTTSSSNPLICPIYKGEYVVTQFTTTGNFKTQKIVVENTENNYLSFFNGTINGETFQLYESFYQPQLNFFASDDSTSPYINTQFIVFPFRRNNQNYSFTLVHHLLPIPDPNVSPKQFYELVKKQLKIGIQPFGRYTTTNEWYSLLTDDSIEPFAHIDKEELEILDIQEVELKPTVPEIYEKAFFIKARINLELNHPNFKNFTGTFAFKYKISRKKGT